jgi:hypothetical protein
MEKIPYWEICNSLIGKKGAPLPVYLVEYQITPDKVTKNPLLNVGKDYIGYFYVNAMQVIGKKNGVANGPILAKPYGGRAISLAGEDNITLGNNEYTLNVKGAGTLAFMEGFKYEDNGYNKMRLYNDDEDIDGHDHIVWTRETGMPGFSYITDSGKFKLTSLITDLDFDSGSRGAHRPIGGQDPYIASEALKSSISMKKDKVKINFCPVLSTVEMDLQDYTKTMCNDEKDKCQTIKKPRYAQEIRLVPSNVRIDSPDYPVGILSINKHSDAIRQDLADKSVDINEFVKNVVDTSKQIYFLPYFSREESSFNRYNSYTFSHSDVPSDTSLDSKGNAFYTDLESIDRTDISKLELLLKTAGVVYDTADEGIPAFIYTLLIANRLCYSEKAGNVRETLKRAKEDYGNSFDGFLSPESYIKINPDDKTIISHVEIDGEGITVKTRFNGKKLQYHSMIINDSF